MCRANGIFNVTEARKIGTFVISSRAATYVADETWAGKILGNVQEEGTAREGTERRGRVRAGESVGTRGITRSEET